MTKQKPFKLFLNGKFTDLFVIKHLDISDQLLWRPALTVVIADVCTKEM